MVPHDKSPFGCSKCVDHCERCPKGANICDTCEPGYARKVINSVNISCDSCEIKNCTKGGLIWTSISRAKKSGAD